MLWLNEKWWETLSSLQWRHNGRNSVSNHQPHDCLLNRLFRRRSKKTSKLHVTGLCAGNSPGTDEFPAQMAGNAENVSIWWRHHGVLTTPCVLYVLLHQGINRVYPYFYWLLQWLRGNRMIATMSVKQAWRIWVIQSPKSRGADKITITT